MPRARSNLATTPDGKALRPHGASSVGGAGGERGGVMSIAHNSEWSQTARAIPDSRPTRIGTRAKRRGSLRGERKIVDGTVDPNLGRQLRSFGMAVTRQQTLASR